jgi:hypothetical protein
MYGESTQPETVASVGYQCAAWQLTGAVARRQTRGALATGRARGFGRRWGRY